MSLSKSDCLDCPMSCPYRQVNQNREQNADKVKTIVNDSPNHCPRCRIVMTANRVKNNRDKDIENCLNHSVSPSCRLRPIRLWPLGEVLVVLSSSPLLPFLTCKALQPVQDSPCISQLRIIPFCHSRFPPASVPSFDRLRPCSLQAGCVSHDYGRIVSPLRTAIARGARYISLPPLVYSVIAY